MRKVSKMEEEEEMSSSESSSSTSTSTSTSTSSSSSESSTSSSKSSNEEEDSAAARSSRLFQAHRTIGILTTHSPYHLQCSGTSSLEAFMTIPIGNRFQIVKCDKLSPVLVSHSLPPSSSSLCHKNKKKEQKMRHVISDAALAITVASHGTTKQTTTHVALYKRTAVIQSLALFTSKKNVNWKIVDMISLGKVKMEVKDNVEKEGNSENVLILALICTKNKLDNNNEEGEYDDDNVQIVGHDSDDDDDESDGDTDSTSDDDSGSDDADNENNKVTILLASRTSLTIHKQILIPSSNKKHSNNNNFTPITSLHPSTYVNKIIIAGSNNTMLLMNVNTRQIIHHFTCFSKQKQTQKEKCTNITALEQSPAVDIIAVGTSSGKLHLVNLRHDVILFTLSHYHSSLKTQSVQITSMSFRTDATAMKFGISPLAVGCDDGSISIWDLTNRSTSDSSRRVLLHRMDNVHPGGISRLDYLPNEPLLLSTGTTSNSILMHLFDNPNHTPTLLKSRSGHTSPPKHIRYVHPNNSFILSNMMDGTDASSCQILSAGSSATQDTSLRVFSTARSVLDKEYSQGKQLVKRAQQLGLTNGKVDLLLPPITSWASSQRHASSSSSKQSFASSDWGDLVTIHSNHALAYVWNTSRGSQCGPVLRQSSWPISAMKKSIISPKHYATSVCMSSCGYFACVGTAGGVVYKYNVQSGLPRGSYPVDATHVEAKTKNMKIAGSIERTRSILEKNMKLDLMTSASLNNKDDDDDEEEEEKKKKRTQQLSSVRHDTNSSITGLAVDALNRTLISIGGSGNNAKIILWDFTTHHPKKMPFKLLASPTSLRYIRDSNLCAISLDDASVLLFDVISYSIVRRFTNGHTGRITDMTLDADGRRLYTASTDKTIRIWDVPTNTCVDWMSFERAPMSMTLSPTGEFLATAHEGKVGIYLWADKSFFRTVYLDGSCPPEKPCRMDEPVPVAEVVLSGENEESHKRLLENQALKHLDHQSQGNNHHRQQGRNDDNDDDENNGKRVPPTSKEDGLVTLSGLPPGHWKNLFHLELVKERNKPKEPPKKPEKAPFFLQWRGSSGTGIEEDSENLSLPAGEGNEGNNVDWKDKKDKSEMKETSTNDDDEWDAAWSDDEDDTNEDKMQEEKEEQTSMKRDVPDDDNVIVTGNARLIPNEDKRRKVTHHRSHLAALLRQCHTSSSTTTLSSTSTTATTKFEAVTKHLSTLGPSAIDVAFSTLCHGSHDLDEGLELLHLASLWLLEEIRCRRNYDSVNAYLHRFLYLHSSVLSGIDEALLMEKEEERNEMKGNNENGQVGRNQGKKKKGKLMSSRGGDVALVDEETRNRQRRRNERMELLKTIGELKKAQREASECLRGKMQNTLCLLRHFSRMV